MTSSILGRNPLFTSIALLCIPLAFQIAAVGVAVPDDMWIVFVLSIWASLTTGGFMLSVLCGAIARLMLRRGRRQSGSGGILRGTLHQTR